MLERFLKYVLIDTTSDSKLTDTPTTIGQVQLAQILVSELNALNMDEIFYDEKHGYVYAKLKGNSDLPKIGFVAHLDTSEDAKGTDIKPNIIYNYDGNEIHLNKNIKMTLKSFPDLKNHIGKTIITTDGTTLLGADDKAGIAEIMEMLKYFSTSLDEHGDILVCFTPDEEINLGTKHFNKEYFNPDFAYTVDGSVLGEFSYENFNAATITITINGISTHLGHAKGILVNSTKIATIINSFIPNELPENTENREGYFHLDEINGTVSKTTMKYLIRDFDKAAFEDRIELLETIVDKLNKEYNNSIEIEVKRSYKNMLEKIIEEPNLINNTKEAIKKVGIEPLILPIRGGTDGTEISYLGIPCPNLGTGGHNFHSIYEYICLEDMEKTVEILISIINQFNKEKIKEKISE